MLYSGGFGMAVGMVALVCLGVAGVTFSGLLVRDFLVALEFRQRQWAESIHIMENICIDPKNFLKLRIVAMCAESAEVLNRVVASNHVWAFFDVMETWHVCGKDGCGRLITSVVDHLGKLAVLSMSAIAFALYLMKKAADRVVRSYEGRFELPRSFDRTSRWLTAGDPSVYMKPLAFPIDSARTNAICEKED